MARITLQSLAHAYRPNPSAPTDYAVREATHIWDDGGAYALLGPSGCGKTTLLNIISGLVRPTRGRVLFDERDVTDLATERRNIAQVFQFPVIYDTMSVAENLAFPLINRGMERSAVKKRVDEIAALLDLTPHLARKARGLTADSKQKISLGRGLVRPNVAAILFDEPLTVIDPHLKWELRSKLKEIHKRLDTTMIYVTHDQTEALTFADKVVVMFEGELVQVGTPQQLFETPDHVFVGYFIGAPSSSLIVSAGSTLLGLLLGAPAAFAVSWHRMSWPATVTLFARMAPGTLFLLPWLIMFTKFGLVGSHLVLILTHAVITLPIVIWVLLPYCDSLPRELVECAQIDGARQDQILRLVVVPILAPGLVVAAILSFVFSWNYFVFALVLSGIHTKTAIVASFNFIGEGVTNWGALMAAAVIIALPPLILTLLIQKQLVGGLAAGAVKG